MMIAAPTGHATEFEGNLQEATDDVLTLAAKSGNGSAFVELSRRHSKKVQARIYRILGNWEDAEDVLQESLLKAFKHLDQFHGTCNFSTWLTQIAINSALMLLRNRRTHPEISYDRITDSTETLESWGFRDFSPNPEHLCAYRESQALLRSAILRLPRSCRTTFELYYARDCSTNEIAQTLGISIAATKSRLLRGRTRLRASVPIRALTTTTRRSQAEFRGSELAADST